jgi:hypothetical protein
LQSFAGSASNWQHLPSLSGHQDRISATNSRDLISGFCQIRSKDKAPHPFQGNGACFSLQILFMMVFSDSFKQGHGSDDITQMA